MRIIMIGVDYTKAPVSVREKFSFTKSAAVSAMQEICHLQGISGCLILSTCNRMEIWHSCLDESCQITDLMEILCKLKKTDVERAASYIVCRQEEEAIRHLFFLAGGLKSQIAGDDQIITQVKDALTLAREAETTDSHLEVLFRMAITAGKKVRAEITFDRGNRSAAAQSIAFLKEKGASFSGRKCLVIGNGEIGKLTAQALVEEGADVTVTVRQYRSGIVCIPKGCSRINYGERYAMIEKCDYVFSATSSPNVTISKEKLEACGNLSEITFVDLAVPRDIEPEIAALPGVTLYDIDALQITHQSEQMQAQFAKAEDILEVKIDEYIAYRSGSRYVTAIQAIGHAASIDICGRIEKNIKKLSISDLEKEQLNQAVAASAEKAVNKMLYALRDELEPQELEKCIKALQK